MNQATLPSSSFSPFDHQMMRLALELAQRGEGFVEPNPLVGCVLTQGETVIGQGYHTRFGSPHAEVEALQSTTVDPRGATAYVTLEPCCHHGKTPPCSAALIAAGIARVVVALTDPFPKVAGGGLGELALAGCEVVTGLLAEEAADLNAPYLKRITTGQPWVIAKWAMTLDGKIATSTGESKWISGEQSRSRVHQLRGRMDGILVGRGTVDADDPLLTARPAGPRTATRIVLDRTASLRNASQLMRSVGEAPLLVIVSPQAETNQLRRLQEAGAEVWLLPENASTEKEQIQQLLRELGRREMTNLLVEGGSRVLGSFLSAQAIDEVHLFLAPKLLGGEQAPGPIGGLGLANLSEALQLNALQAQACGEDWHLFGRRARGDSKNE